jgi:hypothetical protein
MRDEDRRYVGTGQGTKPLARQWGCGERYGLGNNKHSRTAGIRSGKILYFCCGASVCSCEGFRDVPKSQSLQWATRVPSAGTPALSFTD